MGGAEPLVGVRSETSENGTLGTELTEYFAYVMANVASVANNFINSFTPGPQKRGG